MPSLRRASLLLPAAIAALAVAGCSVGDDGPRTTQTRDVAAFTRIDNRDSVDVRLRVGEPQRVQVRAGEKVIDDVGTEVRDGTLSLTFDRDGDEEGGATREGHGSTLGAAGRRHTAGRMRMVRGIAGLRDWGCPPAGSAPRPKEWAAAPTHP